MNDSRRNTTRRIAVVGCGAVARHFYLPVLAGHPGIEIGALVDRELTRAQRLASDYAIGRAHASADALLDLELDGAIVCTPPAEHAAPAILLARRGVHVLVEKPLAPSAADAERMLLAAQDARVVMAAAMSARVLPSSRLIRALIASGWLGRPLRFDLRHGAPYAWPAATLGSMQKAVAGGGVLIDSGVHVLDQLVYFFGHAGRVLRYRDDSQGGVESDALLDLEFGDGAERIQGTVELSRTRTLGNELVIECERGTIELGLHERQTLRIRPRDLCLRDPSTHAARPHALRLAWDDGPAPPQREIFRLVVDDWIAAFDGRTPELDARTALPALRLIDDAYRVVERIPEPGRAWPSARIEPLFGKRRVLITGASGFLGARVAEVLSLAYGWDVRAAVRTPAHASRVARLPVELVQGDLRSREDVERWIAGCSAVVHCAVGDAATTVGGTRSLAEQALAARVQRFVHMSSIAVYGLAPGMTLDESMPLRPLPGDDYGVAKAAAEMEVLRVSARGLAAVLLRPARIYGPWSELFVARPLRDLRRGALAVTRSAADAPAQQVYVDNVVHAIVRALEAPAELAGGQAFNVNDADQRTCGEFYGFFADAAGLNLQVVDDAPVPLWPAGRSRVALRKLRALGRRVGGLLATPELRAAGHRLASAMPPVLGRFAQRAPVYVRAPPAAEPGEVLKPREALIRIEKAERVLGHRQVVTTPEALQRTLEWARYAELLPPG